MFDLKKMEASPELFREAFLSRGMDQVDALMSEMAELLKNRRNLISKTEQLQAERNAASDEIAKLKKSKGDFQSAIARQKEIGPQLKEAEQALRDFEEKLKHFLSSLPNLPAQDVPVGADASANQVVSKWGEPKPFDFPVLTHDELGEKRGWMDFARAASLTGSRFAVLKSFAARLERALIQFMLDVQTKEHSYEEIIPPFIVNRQALYGTGNLPKFEEDLFRVQPHDYFLIPTAEVPLTNLHADSVLLETDLPKYYTAYTPCFRAEAGSYGKDVKGLIRQHQFNKVELVKLSHPEESEAEHQKMLRDACVILERLELPYQVQVLSSGDMGFAAQKTYDIEVWLPSQNTYREISSVSNCGDFQARRMMTRFKSGSSKPQFVHTLNGSGLAVGRTLIAILENFQTAEHKVVVPKALRPYLDQLELA